MNLKHVVITCVDRDELPDGGAAIWAETIRRVHEACPHMSVEALIGDFEGDAERCRLVIDARPEILAHNMETVRRMHPAVRPAGRLSALAGRAAQIKDSGWSPRPASWSASASTMTKCSRSWTMCAAFADTDISHHRPVPAADAQSPADRSLGHA